MKRGFALSMATVILLMFITMLMVIEYQRLNLEETTRSEHARMEAITSIFADMDSPAFNDSLKLIARNILRDMSLEVIDNGYIKNAQGEFCNRYKSKIENEYLKSLNNRGEDLGIEFKIDQFDCELKESDKDPFHLIANIEFTVIGGDPDSMEDLHVEKKIDRVLEVPIEGLPDPMIGYESNLVKGHPEYRNIFNYSIERPNAKLVAEGVVSQGLVYGKLYGIDDEITSRPAILVVKASELSKVKGKLKDYDGVILIGEEYGKLKDVTKTFTGVDKNNLPCSVTVEGTEYEENAPCINCGTYGKIKLVDFGDCDIKSYGLSSKAKWVKDGKWLYYYIAEDPDDPKNYQNGFNIEYDGPFMKVAESGFGRGVIGSLRPGRKVLLFTDKGYTKVNGYIPVYDRGEIADIEDIRGLVLCGHYVESKYGPSYIDRLEGHYENDNQNAPSLETYVLGTWATEEYSKLDWEYFNNRRGYKVAGMPTCLTIEMCDQDDTDISIGHFRISDSKINTLGLRDYKWED